MDIPPDRLLKIRDLVVATMASTQHKNGDPILTLARAAWELIGGLERQQIRCQAMVPREELDGALAKWTACRTDFLRAQRDLAALVELRDKASPDIKRIANERQDFFEKWQAALGEIDRLKDLREEDSTRSPESQNVIDNLRRILRETGEERDRVREEILGFRAAVRQAVEKLETL